MGVDSNVLIFERIREELATKKGARQAVAAGFDRVFLTILDTHVASLISAAFLFQFGTGPIRGFATTLFFGSAGERVHGRVRLAHAVRVRPVAEAGRRGAAEHLRRSLTAAMRILANPNFNFIRWRWHAHRAVGRSSSGPASCAVVSRGGLPLGVDFSGGTRRRPAVRAADRRGGGPRRARAVCRAKPSSSDSAAAATNADHGPAAADGRRREGHQPRRRRQARRGRRCAQANVGEFTVVQQRDRRSGHRRGPASGRASTPRLRRCSAS